jgi:hypothetical protein
MVKALVDVLVLAFQNPDCQKGMASLLEECFHKILLDKETIDKFRIFVYNLMAMELEDNKSKKSSLLDLMLSKAVARKTTSGSDIQALIENRPATPPPTLTKPLDPIEEIQLKDQPPTTDVDNKIL